MNEAALIPAAFLIAAFVVGAFGTRDYLNRRKASKGQSKPAEAPKVEPALVIQPESNEEKAQRFKAQIPPAEQPEGIGPILKRAISKEIERPIREGHFRVVIKNRGAVVNSGAEPQWEIEFPEDKPVSAPAEGKKEETQVRAPTQADVSGDD